MKDNIMKNDRVPTLRLIAFSLPGFVTAFMRGPTGSILPAIYAKYYGLDMAMIGTVLMIARLFDAVTDPVIGYLSDRTKTRLGRRKPWIIAGYGLTIVVIYYLFIPPEKITTMFFLFWFSMMYLVWTMAEIPYSAWSMELSRDYKERSRIMTYRGVMMVVGGLLFAVLPLLPMFETNNITPEVVRVLGYCVIVGLPIATAIAVIFTPEGKHVEVRESTNVKELYESIRYNKPMQLYLIVSVLYWFAMGMQSATGFLAIDTYYLIGDKYPYILILGSVLSLATLPVWLRIIYRFGKIKTFLGVQIFYVATLPFLAFIPPGVGALIPFVVIYCLMSLSTSAGEVLPPALLGDVIDYDLLKTGVNRTAQYSSVLTLLGKFNGAIGTGVAFYVIGALGYDASETEHDFLATAGLMSMFVWVPFILTAISCIFLKMFPLTEHRQAIIKRRIETRAARAARAKQVQR